MGTLYIYVVVGGMLYEMLIDPMYLILFLLTSIVGLPLFGLYAYGHHAHDGEPIRTFVKRYSGEICVHAGGFIIQTAMHQIREIHSEYKIASAKYKKQPVQKD